MSLSFTHTASLHVQVPLLKDEPCERRRICSVPVLRKSSVRTELMPVHSGATCEKREEGRGRGLGVGGS